MIDFNAITQTKAFARQDGVFLSMLWIVTFALVIYAPQTDLGGLLVFSTPLFVAWRMIKFRNYALDGVMSYRKALVYCIWCNEYCRASDDASLQREWYQYTRADRWLDASWSPYPHGVIISDYRLWNTDRLVQFYLYCVLCQTQTLNYLFRTNGYNSCYPSL